MTRFPRAVVTTPRLRLEPIERGHAEGLWRAKEASLAELRRWLAWALSDDPERSRGFVEASRRGWDAGTDWVFVLVLAGEPIGAIGLHEHDALGARAELGYWLRSDVAGRGLMTEAAAAVVDFGFEVLGLHRIQLRAAPGNAASTRVAEKVGFRREGLMRDSGRGEAGWHDESLYGMLATDERMRSRAID
jgi:RimJ/RimL family protein N-acetyltransferase